MTLLQLITGTGNKAERIAERRWMQYTVTNGCAAFDTLQAPIPHITVYYICIHKQITFVTLLHLITPQ